MDDMKKTDQPLANLGELAELDLYAEELPERLNALKTACAFTAATAGTFGTATSCFGTLGTGSSASTLSV